jgi:hypothetical protein
MHGVFSTDDMVHMTHSGTIWSSKHTSSNKKKGHKKETIELTSNITKKAKAKTVQCEKGQCM